MCHSLDQMFYPDNVFEVPFNGIQGEEYNIIEHHVSHTIYATSSGLNKHESHGGLDCGLLIELPGGEKSLSSPC